MILIVDNTTGDTGVGGDGEGGGQLMTTHMLKAKALHCSRKHCVPFQGAAHSSTW